MFPLYLPDRSKSGLYSGLLNGACYAGSAVSSYGLGAFADSFGWYSVFQLLLASCIVPVIISVVRAVVKIIKRKKTLN